MFPQSLLETLFSPDALTSETGSPARIDSLVYRTRPLKCGGMTSFLNAPTCEVK